MDEDARGNGLNASRPGFQTSSTARSLSRSTPTTRAGIRVWSASRTWMPSWRAASTTARLVTTWSLSSKIQPVPQRMEEGPASPVTKTTLRREASNACTRANSSRRRLRLTTRSFRAADTGGCRGIAPEDLLCIEAGAASSSAAQSAARMRRRWTFRLALFQSATTACKPWVTKAAKRLAMTTTGGAWVPTRAEAPRAAAASPTRTSCDDASGAEGNAR
mmetsp:Transcript_26054/g.72859  ORF Transcript_26054/g.72859 Transcript_26054/m.72859 type:complete len:219 (-) Transcript_26054:226-882(-)